MKKAGWVIGGISFLTAGIFVGRFLECRKTEAQYKELKERLAKFEDYFAIANRWLKNRNRQISVADYFKKNHYEKVAIYGMGEIGKRLYEELKEEGVVIEAVFDRSAQRLDPSLKVCSLDGPIPELDVVVITPTFDYDAIEEQLKKVISCKIISISEVVMG